MTTSAINQAGHGNVIVDDPLDSIPARWSTADDLLVWTVARIDGGRRHGVERDCHVVYALSRGYFVEQTRKYRASAEQCIEMLQRGKRAGTTQRKIALDTIIALHSDPRTGRLGIRTLNGTHRLEPVSNDEADVLREIAAELQLRMPVGGAEFTDLTTNVPVERDRRRNGEESDGLAERERRALAALENAREEDFPDTFEDDPIVARTESPEDTDAYEPEPTTAAFAEEPATAPEPAEVHEPSAAPPVAHDLARIAAAVHAEMGPESEPTTLPADITVAGGVDIRFEPESAPAPHVGPEQVAERVVPDEVAEHVVPEPLLTEHAEWAAEQPEAVPTTLPAMDLPGERPFDRRSAEPGDLPEHFDRRLRRTVNDRNPAPAFVASEAPAQPDHGIDLPSGAVFQPAAAATQIEPVAPEFPVQTDPAPFERRRTEDPNFPAVFDRRNTTNAEPQPGWAPFHTEAETEPAAEQAPAVNAEPHGYEPEVELAEGPPTISAPAVGQVVSGGAVGFNPDFDVNPFR